MDPDPGSGIFVTLDPGSGIEKFGSGILDKHPGSATQFITPLLWFQAGPVPDTQREFRHASGLAPPLLGGGLKGGLPLHLPAALALAAALTLAAARSHGDFNASAAAPRDRPLAVSLHRIIGPSLPPQTNLIKSVLLFSLAI